MISKETIDVQRILITMGEPAGIGPELIVKLAQLKFPVQLVVLGDSSHLSSIALKLQVPLELTEIDWRSSPQVHRAGHLWIEEHSLEEPVNLGKLSSANAKTVLAILSRSSELALSGKVQAIVTPPVHKANLNKVDKKFLGHTEYFAERAGIDQVVMMLACQGLRITLATTHIPLAKVASTVSAELIESVLNVIIHSTQKITSRQLKIAVCGLNPHAGEQGLLGSEDDNIILPVIKKLQQQGKSVEGPFPADTLFTPQKRKRYDLFLAMYHDQGLPVVKTLGFGQCANVTLGLPYIRTSVDHGTALDIAKDLSASEDSLVYAVNYAIQLSQGNLPE
jgi:4-hydroxythreonine-4-phosphate dehydrogenase